MSIDQFQADAAACEDALARARRVGTIGSWLTLGLWRNAVAVRRAEQLLATAQSDLRILSERTPELERLRQRLKEWIEIRGVRIARIAFPDVLLDGRHTYPVDWDILRDQILARDAYRCQHADGCCRGPLQIHHIRWLSQGGTNDPSNLVTLCRMHHGVEHPGNPAFEGD